MKKSQRIQVIKKLAAFREKEAVSALGMARQDLAGKEARYQELLHFRQDYLTSMQSLGRAGIGAEQLRGYQRFLDQLALAIKQQAQLVTAAESAVAQKQSEWLGVRQKQQIYEKVDLRYRAEERQLEDKLEQKQTDEVAGNIAQRRNE